jgi:hypothetical protein
VSKTRSRICTIASLLCLWVSVPAPATNINPADAPTVVEPHSMSPQDRRFVTALLFDFSPFTANNRTIVPGFADPLGTGIDPGLKLFSGKVYFMDLLGSVDVSSSEDHVDIELPPGALDGVNLLDNLISMYLSYDGRAFDNSLFNLETAEVIERNGLPVTSETSPLSLSGFGAVSDNLTPFNVHWTRCPAQGKREREMAKSIKLFRGPCSVPGVCECYGQ